MVAVVLEPTGLGWRSVGNEQVVDFGQYVSEHQSGLLAFAQLVCGSRHQAEDVLQEVLAKAYPRWDHIGSAGVDTRAYLNRMVVNERNSLWRRAFRRHEVSTDQLPETGVVDADRHDATWEHVMQLPPRQRQVVALRFYADMSVADTAKALRCTEGTVKSQTHHALATLREALATQGAAS